MVKITYLKKDNWSNLVDKPWCVHWRLDVDSNVRSNEEDDSRS